VEEADVGAGDDTDAVGEAAPPLFSPVGSSLSREPANLLDKEEALAIRIISSSEEETDGDSLRSEMNSVYSPCLAYLVRHRRVRPPSSSPSAMATFQVEGVVFRLGAAGTTSSSSSESSFISFCFRGRPLFPVGAGADLLRFI